jgi:hypothetical protein
MGRAAVRRIRPLRRSQPAGFGELRAEPGRLVQFPIHFTPPAFVFPII